MPILCLLAVGYERKQVSTADGGSYKKEETRNKRLLHGTGYPFSQMAKPPNTFGQWPTPIPANLSPFHSDCSDNRAFATLKLFHLLHFAWKIAMDPCASFLVFALDKNII